MSNILDIFCISGIIVCIGIGAVIYKPPIQPPKQCNYSGVKITFIAEKRPVGFPEILREE